MSCSCAFPVLFLCFQLCATFRAWLSWFSILQFSSCLWHPLTLALSSLQTWYASPCIRWICWYPVAVPSSASPRMHPAHPKQPLKKMVNFGDLWLFFMYRKHPWSLCLGSSQHMSTVTVNIHAKWLLGTKVHWRVMKCTSDAALTWMPNNSPQRKPPAVKALWWFVYNPSYNAFEPLLLCIRLPYHSCISIPLVHLKIQLL